MVPRGISAETGVAPCFMATLRTGAPLPQAAHAMEGPTPGLALIHAAGPW